MRAVRMLRYAVLLAIGPALLSAQERPRQVILFIGDGVGLSAWTAARIASEAPLAVASFRTLGLVDTRSSNAVITESAAAATAYATGVRTFNGAIGMGPDTQPRRTVLQVARDRGWRTGLVATSSVTHATPAAFAAHVRSRSMEFEIARQIVENRVDVVLGGGLRFFADSTRPDSVDLLEPLRRTHTVVTRPADFAALDASKLSRVFALLAREGMPPAASRAPTLPQMTRLALDVLGREGGGFFLVVEGSQPDWRAHDNAPLDQVVAEMLDFDAAIGVALEYQRRNPATLVLVVADHETGGLAIHQARVEGILQPVARYTTTGHTAQMVPMFAGGPGADRFAGMIAIDRVGQLLMELVRP